MRLYKFGHYALQAWKVPNLRGRILPSDELILPEFVVFGSGGGSPTSDDKIKIHKCIIQGAENYTSPDGVCLPELAYMQVANSLNKIELIYLGLQLVSGYEGKPPITTIEAIYNCAISLVGFHGRRKVLKALPYLCEGSRSPMETLTYMKLCLPIHLGGRGFRKFVFNYPIYSETYRSQFFADLCWPEKKLIIEYQGSHHNEEWQRKKDLKRQKILENEGYQVIEVWNEDLHDKERFEDLVLRIQNAAKARVRYLSGKFVENYIKIRDILFSYGYQHTRRASSLTKIRRTELPSRPWISKAYHLYLRWHEQFITRFKSKYFSTNPFSYP